MPGLLVVDDEALVRSTVATIVTRGNLDVGPIMEAGDGSEAIILARRTRPDIMLIDVKMPGIDGLEATRVIRSEQPDIQVILLSAYDEFAFAQQAVRLGAVDYLLKPVRPATLLDTLSRTRESVAREKTRQREASQAHGQLRDTLPLAEARLVHDLISGMAADHDVVHRVLEHLGRQIVQPAVVLVDIDQAYWALQGMPQPQLDSLCAMLPDAVRQAIPFPDASLVAQVRRGVVAAIVTTHARLDTVDKLRSLGHAIRYTVKMRAQVIAARHFAQPSSSVTATVGVGGTADSLAAIALSYAEAEHAQRYRLYLGRDSVIHIDDVRAIERETRAYPLDVERHLLMAARTGDRETSRDDMTQLMDYLLQVPNDSPDALHARFTELTALLSRAALEGGAPQAEVLRTSQHQLAALVILESREDIQQWALDCLEAFLSLAEITSQRDHVLQRATEYIQQHYARTNLMLSDVAEAVHLSPSHLGHLLRLRHGVSFIHYLTDLRVEKSKQLLANTDLTIAAIASQVGYDDATYFHRVFRRVSGMTPTSFRQHFQV